MFLIRKNRPTGKEGNVKKYVPTYEGTLRKHALTVPHCISKCSGIRVFGRRIKSLVFSTDVAIIKNINADAVIAAVLNTVPVGGMATPVSVNFQADRRPLEHVPQPVMTEAQRRADQERIAAFLRDHQLQQRLHQAND